MNNAKLFNEPHSELFLTLCSVINKIHSGEKMTAQDILNSFPHIDNTDNEHLHTLMNTVFSFDQQGYARLFLHKPIPYIVTHYQLRWLKEMLLSPECSFLLSDNIREKLLARLKNLSPLTTADSFTSQRENGDKNHPLINTETMSLIWQALRTHKKIAYIYQDNSGNIHQDTSPPCRLEYDCAWHRHRLILWNEKENRAVKLNITNIQKIELTDIDYDKQEIENLFTSFLEQKKTHVTLQLFSRYNAVNRCFALFSSYDKQSVYDEDSDTYTLKIDYYQFDQEEIINYILSLGASVTVLEPADIRQKVIDRLKAEWKLLNK